MSEAAVRLFSSVDAYLRSLPRGIDSYPETCVKGTVVRAIALSLADDRVLRAGLPPQTERLIAEPPLVSQWVPEVHLNVLFSAICEQRHPSPDSFETWAYEGNRRLLAGPLYRVLFAVLSPERALRGTHSRFSAFRRGTTLSALEIGPRGGRVRLAYPPRLMPDVALRAMRAAFRAAADAAGAEQVSIDFEEESSSATRFDVRWA